MNTSELKIYKYNQDLLCNRGFTLYINSIANVSQMEQRNILVTDYSMKLFSDIFSSY